jgi:toxin ParE1/3/4
VSPAYVVRPQADRDLEEQAYYYATKGSPELGHRFIVAAHETFTLLSTRPEMGWRRQMQHPALESLRVFRISGFERVIILYRPGRSGVDILRVVHGSRNLESLLRREGLPDTP